MKAGNRESHQQTMELLMFFVIILVINKILYYARSTLLTKQENVK